jgi:hypothetical protein
MNEYGSAIDQLSKLESFANVESSLKDPPVCMPQDRIRAAGIDPDLWYGLGIVGVWAAIDTFGERTGLRGGSLTQRFEARVAASQHAVLSELDDLRNLFAHNFGGVADRTYLADRRRLCLKENQPYVLSCGYRFNGVANERITLTLDHFRYYVSQTRSILACLK